MTNENKNEIIKQVKNNMLDESLKYNTTEKLNKSIYYKKCLIYLINEIAFNNNINITTTGQNEILKALGFTEL